MIDGYEQIERALTSSEIKHVRADFYSRHRAIINSEYPILCVCSPEIKRLVKSVDKSARQKVINEILASSNKTFESVLIAGCIAARKGDYEFTKENLRRIIPTFDSWAHVDSVVPWLKWVNIDAFLHDFEYLINEKNQYSVRFYIIFLLDYCITKERISFTEKTLKKIKYGDYYVDMGTAWLLAEIIVKDYEKGLEILKNGDFPKFVHNKALQKARESFRITEEQKEYLKTLKK